MTNLNVKNQLDDFLEKFNFKSAKNLHTSMFKVNLISDSKFACLGELNAKYVFKEIAEKFKGN